MGHFPWTRHVPLLCVPRTALGGQGAVTDVPIMQRLTKAAGKMTLWGNLAMLSANPEWEWGWRMREGLGEGGEPVKFYDLDSVQNVHSHAGKTGLAVVLFLSLSPNIWEGPYHISA